MKSQSLDAGTIPPPSPSAPPILDEAEPVPFFAEVSPEAMSGALAAAKYETARRIGLELLAQKRLRDAKSFFLLHAALVRLGDLRAAIALLKDEGEGCGLDRFDALLALAEDYRTMVDEGHYRSSAEKSQGLTLHEYLAKYRETSQATFDEARLLAGTPERAARLDDSRARCGFPRLHPVPATPAPAAPVPRAPARIDGRILHADGSPAVGVTVTLGLESGHRPDDPAAYITHSLWYRPDIAPVEKMTVKTGPSGEFSFGEVPAGTHEFLAVTLDPAAWEIPTRFLARSIKAAPGASVDLGDLAIREWESAPSRPFESPHPETLGKEGVRWEKIAEWKLRNPFHYDFPRQLLRLPLPAGTDPDEGSFRVAFGRGGDEPHQVVGGAVAVMAALPAMSDGAIALYRSAKKRPAPRPSAALRIVSEPDGVRRIDAGPASFRIAGENPRSLTAPLLSVRGPDGQWRGRGRISLPPGVFLLRQTGVMVEEGPLLAEARVDYELTGGLRYSVSLTALAGEPYLLVHERSPGLDGGAFEFSLSEFSGGRGFLHWTPENGGLHWTTLERKETEIARLAESVPWWIPPQGFGYSMTAEGLRGRDYIGVFTLRRGEWIDRKFERIAQGPIDEDGRENRELDWPYPEMVGSSISMITARTDASGDAYFRFGLFDGERQWGILVSSFEKNDGPFKEIGLVQHANSSPRLQEFKDWHLDEPDTVARPHLTAPRNRLTALRAKSASPRFGALWRKVAGGTVPGPTQGLAFAIDGDPAVAWQKRMELLNVAPIRSKMTLLGRDWSDMYCPVGGRPITHWAEEYDLIAASGVFTEEEERLLRSFFILMAHMFMETDLMNWKFNSRNANFEADRTEIIGVIGLAFEGHPDSGKFLDHVVDLTRRSLLCYCTPGSGKWYENPAGYYNHASKCRMNLAYHLATRGRLDLETVPRLKEFLRWGILLLMPPLPTAYAVMRDGGGAAFRDAEKSRRVAPIGDHASLGWGLPEHYAFIGKLFSHSDPEFARELLNAYFAANDDGARLLENSVASRAEGDPAWVPDYSPSGNLSHLFVSIEEEDLPGRGVPTLPSRRLEGFGSVIRDRVGTPDESYLLIKQGPGGYRYQRTEGSFILFANGHPLVFEGGGAGETWRHNTLSFHDVHMPLSAGRVERCLFDPLFQFSQGVHPEIIAPGQPIYLSDSCEHELVNECYRRFRKEAPAVVRSFAWVGGSYLVVHDSLCIDPEILSHWHLQVVGGTPGGNAAAGYRFPGRFGTDLQLVLPSQSFDAEQVRELSIYEAHGPAEECFAMQNLQLTRKGSGDYLAVLRPLSGPDDPGIAATAIRREDRIVGVSVTGDSFRDLLWFDRGGIEVSEGNASFSGKYGAALDRPEGATLVLCDAGEVRLGEVSLRGDGPRAVLTRAGGTARLRAEGYGILLVGIGNDSHPFKVEGSGEWTVGG